MPKATTALFGDLAVLPIEASVPCLETLLWATDIIVSHDGTEDRTRLLAEPRQAFTFRLPESISIHAEANIAHGLALRLEWAVPIWTESQTIGAVSSGASTVTVTTDNYDFRTNSLGMLYESPSNFEIIEISTLTSSVLTLSKNVVNTYTNPKVLPVRRGVIVGDVIKDSTGYSATTRITFAIIDNLALTPQSTPDQFLGDDIYFDEPLAKASGRYKHTITSRVDKSDFDIGLFEQRSPWLHNRARRTAKAIHQGAAEIRAFKRFLERRAGKLAQYWEPSFEADLMLASNNIIGDRLIVEDTGLQDWSMERTHIAIQDECGDWYPRTILAFNALGGGKMELVMDAVLPLRPESIQLITYLGLKRFDTDRVLISWKGNNVILSNINTVEITP